MSDHQPRTCQHCWHVDTSSYLAMPSEFCCWCGAIRINNQITPSFTPHGPFVEIIESMGDTGYVELDDDIDAALSQGFSRFVRDALR